MDRTAPLSVLHFSSWKVRCGIADYTADLVGGLNRHGVSNTAVPIEAAQNKTMSQAEMLRQYADLAKQARDHDLVHIQHEYSFFSAASMTQANTNFAICLDGIVKTGKPVVITFHSEPPPGVASAFKAPLGLKARIKRKIKKTLLKAVGRAKEPLPELDAVAIFNRHRDNFQAIVHTRRTRMSKMMLGYAGEHISVVPMGYKPRSNGIFIDKAEAKRRLNLPADCKLLSLFGFISRYKGPHVAASALRLLPPDYHLALVGGLHPNSTEPILNEVLKIWHNQDPNRLKITGYLPEPEVDLWQAATDISLAPYLEIGMSGSAGITWAISSGKPVIASKTVTFREIQEDSDAMLMVAPNSPYELAWQIKRLTESPEMAADLVRKAQAYADDCSWERTAERVINIYKQFPSVAPATLPLPLRRAA